MRGSLILCAAALLAARAVGAVPQSSDQQRCINDVNKYGVRVARSQNRGDLDCLRNASRGIVSRLGVPPQTQTARACLTNDVGARVGREAQKLIDRDAKSCLASPGQLPGFGYAGGASANAAARGAGVAIVAGLFGSGLDAAVVPSASDRDGADCQADVLRYSGDLFYAVWKEALDAKKNVLKGARRLAGTGPVSSAADLTAELIATVQADAKGKIAKAADKLHDRTTRACTGAQTPIGQMFPGTCSASPTLDALADCVEGVARGQFFASLAATDALAIDCDLQDNGATDLSCESPALREHVLNRLGYGGDAWSRARIQTLGVRDYIDEQLSPETIDDSAVDAALVAFPSLTQTFQQLRANYANNPVPPQQGLGVIARELKQAKVLRSVMTRRQLAEVLVDFWQNHFNVAAGSSQRTKYDISPYDRITLRPNVLGTFENLLLADARSPAMGDYLDNRRNHVNALNENYAREVMELHTLSVNGPYTETDVPELARCFTGWREDYSNAVDGFQFVLAQHDQGTKNPLGIAIPANGGMQDGLTMIDFLSHHQSTAQFISRKLIIRFVSETPPQRLLDEATGVFLGTGGDIRAVLRDVFLSPEFLQSTQYRHAKVKRPLVFYASLARSLGANPTQINTNTLRNRVADMGEDLYDAGPPTGYPDVSTFWFSPGTAVKRFNDAEATSRGSYGFVFTYPIAGGTSVQVIDALSSMLFTGPVSSATRLAGIGFLDTLPEPDPTTRIRQAAALLLSTPEFLTH